MIDRRIVYQVCVPACTLTYISYALRVFIAAFRSLRRYVAMHNGGIQGSCSLAT